MRDDVVLRFAQRALGKPARSDRRGTEPVNDPTPTVSRPPAAPHEPPAHLPLGINVQSLAEVLAMRLLAAGIDNASQVADQIAPLVAGDLATLLGTSSEASRRPPDPGRRLTGSRSRLPDPPLTPAFAPPAPADADADADAETSGEGEVSEVTEVASVTEVTRLTDGSEVAEVVEVAEVTEVAEVAEVTDTAEPSPRPTLPPRDHGETPLGFTLD